MRLINTLIIFLGFISLNGQSCNEPTFSSTYWSSYFGGNGIDEIMDIAIDQSTGQVYIIGHTTSTNFPSNNTIGPVGLKNTFVSSINADASVAWTTIIGGWETPHKVELDPNGDLVLLGMTTSNTLPGPSSVPGFDKSYNGGQDIMILKLDATGQNITYSSYYGGNGDESNEQDGTLEVNIYQDRLYIIGNTTSTNLTPSANAIDQSPGDLYLTVLDLAINTQVYFTYLSYQKPNFLGSYALAVNSVGELSIILSYNSNYSSLISTNAVQSVADNDNPHPILLRFNSNFDITYGTYLSPINRIWTSTSCNSNGVVFEYNYYDFDLEIDNANNVYFYQTGNNFRSPLLRKQDIAFARNYFPDLTAFTTNCENTTGSTIMKVNFCKEAIPFIENLIFGLWGDGSVSPPAVVSEIEVDDLGRVHFVTSYDSSSPIYNIGNDPISEYGGNYIIYDVGLQSTTVNILFPAEFPVYPRKNYHNQLELYDNKAYMVGRASDIITSTPLWTDEFGNSNTIPQAIYGGGASDGIIHVIDNNCIDLPYDCCNLHPEYNLLKEFYDSTNGSTWTNNNGWETNCNPCSWFGVTCDANQNVIGLNFWNNNLTGTIPNSICNLIELKTLVIRENSVGGVIPPCIGQMKNLTWLQLNNNMFTGNIPDFTGTPGLSFLSLANNQLTGQIPGSIGSLPLSTFSVIENDLDGCFDPALNQLCSNGNIIQQAINPGNNFDALWSDFCATGAGSCTVGTNDNTLKNQITVYPNPFKERLVITSSSNRETNMTILNISGGVLQKFILAPNASFELDDLYVSGMYFLQISNGISKYYQKIVKL